MKANEPTKRLQMVLSILNYQNSKENDASALLSEGKWEITEGAKKEQTVAVRYIVPIANAPNEST